MKLGIDKGGSVGHSLLNASDVRPARGLLLVKPNERKRLSDGGIILPETMKEKKAESGVVVRGGLSPRNPKTGLQVPWPVEIGSEVYYSWTAGTEVKTAQGVFLLLLHNEIIMTDHDSTSSR